jgi:hypothetical protein
MAIPKILHILDDEIISLAVIDLFKEIKIDQNYLICTKDLKEKSNISGIKYLSLESASYRKQLKKAVDAHDIIFLQALSFEKARLIAKHSWSKKVFVWCLWGYELYNSINYRTNKANRFNLKSSITNFYTYSIIYSRAFRKIDYCLFLLEHDYKLLINFYNTSAQWLSGSYQFVESYIDIPAPIGSNILVGNSSTESNRHELIFEHLEGVTIADRLLICPLNYGNFTYRQKVISSGHNKFGKIFNPLLNFLPFDEYTNLLQSCSHVIFGHKRQQAFGTILQMLYQGSRVYLSEESPFLSYFKEMGISVFSLEQDLKNTIDKPLESKFILSNKIILKKLFNKSSVIQNLKQVQISAVENWKRKNEKS